MKKIIYITINIILVVNCLFSNERHFTYIYETGVLPPGAKEIEIWHSERLIRRGFYHKIDQRLEIEWGIISSLQAAFYFNFSAEQTENGTNAEYKNVNKKFGSSLELKYKFFPQWLLAVRFRLS